MKKYLYFQNQELVRRMPLCHSSANLCNVQFNGRYICFFYRLLLSVYCNITHRVDSGKLQRILTSEWEDKKGHNVLVLLCK